ncbi:MAG: Ca2+-dependent phosphoinositide-specific phospholipase C [Limisphaerales bacterium]|jgi:hypothetical protein
MHRIVLSLIPLIGLTSLSLHAATTANLQPDLAIPDSTPLNAIQVIGSHNSYKLLPAPEVEKMIAAVAPAAAKELHYEHEPLPDQLNRGLRNLEIDVLYDPEGGRYANPLALKLLSSQHPPFDRTPMLSPGYKVLHAPDIDFRSHHATFADCLQTLKAWSEQNPQHAPVFITMNIKEDKAYVPGGVNALPFTETAALDLNQEILTHLGPKHLLSPAQAQANASSLNQAITQNQWPSLRQTRGKFIFILDAGTPTLNTYSQAVPPSNRVAFSSYPPGHPDSAFLILNNPISSSNEIKTLAAQGYIIRTRADSGTHEARQNNTARRDTALQSSAHIITTDYYPGRNLFTNSYSVAFPNQTFIRLHPSTP